MTDIDALLEKVKSYNAGTARVARDEIRKELRSVEYVTVERDTYKAEAIRLSEENARLTVALQGKTSPIHAELDPAIVGLLLSEVKRVGDGGRYDSVSRVTVVSDTGLALDRYNLYENGVWLDVQDDGKTLKIFPLPVKEEGK